MRKLLIPGLLAVFVLFLPTRSRAAGPINPAYTYSVAVSSGNTNVITVSNSVPTQVDSPPMVNRAVIEVQNIDSTANLWCVVGSSSAPTVPAANSGRLIASKASWIVSVLDTFYMPQYSTITFTSTTLLVPAKVWCISDGAGSTKAAVTQLY